MNLMLIIELTQELIIYLIWTNVILKQMLLPQSQINFLKILFIFRERGREGEREGEKHQCVVAFHVPPIGDLAYNPGLSPDWESNLQPFGLQAHAQSTEPHQPVLKSILTIKMNKVYPYGCDYERK